jgi:hypothetical protein
MTRCGPARHAAEPSLAARFSNPSIREVTFDEALAPIHEGTPRAATWRPAAARPAPEVAVAAAPPTRDAAQAVGQTEVSHGSPHRD